MLYLPNEYSQESRLKICVFKTDRSRLGHEVSALTEPVAAASLRPATTQGCRRAGVN